VRTIPLPSPLADLIDLLIAIFHTDAETGRVDGEARLIPGLRSENTSGQSTFRTWLSKAQEQSGTSFKPHDLRGALITDLKDAGVEERLAHYYAGRAAPALRREAVRCGMASGRHTSCRAARG
jgi:integrase